MRRLIIIFLLVYPCIMCAQDTKKKKYLHFNGLNLQYTPVSYIAHSGHYKDDFYTKLVSPTLYNNGRFNDIRNNTAIVEPIPMLNTWAIFQNVDLNVSFKLEHIKKWPALNKEIRVGAQVLSINLPPVYMEWNSGETFFGSRHATFGLDNLTSIIHAEFLVSKLFTDRLAFYGGIGIEAGKSLITEFVLMDTFKLHSFDPINFSYYINSYEKTIPLHILGGKAIGGFKINVSCNVNLYAEADLTYFSAFNKAAVFHYGIFNLWSGIRIKFNKPEKKEEMKKKDVNWVW